MASVLALAAGTASAEKMTAGAILERMSSKEQTAYLAGVIEGLATARYYADGKATAGRACINNWFYEAEGTQRKIIAAFDKYPDRFAGEILAVLLRTECGG